MTCEELYKKLIDTINKYHPKTRLGLVERAYLLASSAHEGQLRKSGEPYFTHPLWVAVILAELRMDTETIVAALLHDVAEDTVKTIEDISAEFGKEITDLVDGVTKLEKISYSSKTDEQAENYRKMFFAMSKDIRVIILKICDRLHNMRTLQYQSEQKQKEIAQETLEIYAPLAHRLGISRIRYELEDLGFKYIDREAYNSLAAKISLKQAQRKKMVDEIVAKIQARLDSSPVKASVEGRAKHFFSIYKKMISKDKQLDEIYDLFAVRIIVNSIDECYAVFGILHDMYTPVPGRVKDFIGMPKPNQYQCLHTTMLSGGEPFEAQIRTWDMHAVAEYGIAAHWRYKSGVSAEDEQANEKSKHKWLGQILEWQRELSDNEEYIDAVKVDLSIYNKNVYCFSPKGDVVSLPSGSTVIDFAYSIHSAVGNHMVGARVNGALVPFEQTLSTGDRVEIITSLNQTPNQDWLDIVKTTQARAKINQWFKKQNRPDNIQRGKDLLEACAKTLKLSLSDLLDEGREKIVLERYHFLDFDSLCATIGHGGLREQQVINRLHEAYKAARPPTYEEIRDELLKSGEKELTGRKSKSGILIEGIGDTNVRFSKCCSPLPGDEVVGFITRGRGVSIHRTDCVNIIHLDEINRQRIIEADWHLENNQQAYRADIRVSCMDRSGMLADIAKVLSDDGFSVKAINARTQNGEVIMDIGVEVLSLSQFERLKTRIKQQAGVFSIERLTT